MVPTSVPSTRSSGTEPSAISATGRPSWRTDAATSVPIQPPPITTTRCAPATASRIASASSSVRR